MIDIEAENKAFYWATLFLRSLWRQGLKHIIISPGSRSTPLTMAAAAFPGLKKHVILDERSAAFMGLGIGKATNCPAALICTSGTAVANYYPAVVEARKSGTPLLLLTADRPAHLHSTGANQTIKQHHIFGDYPVFFRDAGEPVIEAHVLDNLKNIAGQAFGYSRTRQGPVHLNFPFSKPLEPQQDFVESISKKNQSLTDDFPAPSFSTGNEKQQLDKELRKALNTSQQPLIIAAQLAAQSKRQAVFAFAKALNVPILSETGALNQEFGIQGFEGFLRREKHQSALKPDFILRFGLQPASKSVLQTIKKWDDIPHYYFYDSETKSSISNTTTHFISWKGGFFETCDVRKKKGGWLDKWKTAEHAYFGSSEKIFANSAALTDGHVYHHYAPHIPESCEVFISNSFPARDHSMFGKWGSQRIYTNRGASGIDGITSSAMGVSIGLDKPVILFTGDLAFLHDSNALLNQKELTQPVVIIVINNSGGSIFRMLPIAHHKDHFEQYFETPQSAKIQKIAEANNINYTLVNNVNTMKDIILKEFSYSGLYVVECKTDADESMKIRNLLWEQY